MKSWPHFFTGTVLLFAINFLSAQPFGLSNRVGNTTLRMPPTPPSSIVVTTNAFPTLTITAPICFATPPGETNRLFVLERAGRVIVITNLALPTRTVFMDIASRVTGGCEEGLLGIAFHPGYATNRYFFLFYSLNTNTAAGSGVHQRLARFETSPANPNQGLVSSEVPLITQRDEACNHNGGDLHFGPDGYLYISVGDEGQQNDALRNSQRIDKDFFSGILRIDVDKLPGNLPPHSHAALMNMTNYFVPADNPWVGATQFNGVALPNSNAVRTEFWAVGLRNPWRFSFDEFTGTLYEGDVGGDVREEINVIVGGGNYGWNYREGTLVRSNNVPTGFSPRPPIVEYNHGTGTNQGNSVIGGVLYRGSRLAGLNGRYIFADYVSGRIWALTPDGTNVVPFDLLTTDPGIAAFGIDPSNGDVLLADIDESRIKRLVPAGGGSFPQTLVDTGAFTNLATLTPHAGIQSYDINLPFWSDGGQKSRWFYIPTNRMITFRATNNWTFPTGSVWIKHFELELTNGVASSRKRVETRFIVRDSGQGVYGVTYRWGDSVTNAMLVPDGGLDETFVLNDGGVLRTQVWHYPSRGECLVCHTASTLGGLALGFNTPQLNRDFDYGGVVDNQIRAMANAGYFNQAVSNLNSLRALAALTNESASVEQRVRSYLAANCAQCHQPAGPGQGFFDARIFTPLSTTRLINGALMNDGGDAANRVVVPGSISHSMLLTRISIRGSGQMPPLDSTVADAQAIALVSRWITNDLVRYQTFPDWQLANFGSTNAPEAMSGADPDGDGARNDSEYLMGTNPNQALDFWDLGIERSGATAELVYPVVPNRGVTLQWSDALTNPVPWRFFDVPQNRPFFSATAGVMRVVVPATNAPARFFRAEIYEP
jgi:glucose/arabinose dehydrogenase/mono/diheme cytochrome c family protein